MLLTKEEITAASKNVTRKAVTIAALLVFRYLVEFLPGGEYELGLMSISRYLTTGISLTALVLMIQAFADFKTVATFFITTWVSSMQADITEVHESLVGIGTNIIYLIYLILLYQFGMPLILLVNSFLLHARGIVALASLLCVIFGIILLVRIWKNLQPILAIWTSTTEKGLHGKIEIAYVACPACGASNPRKAAYCAACGGIIPALLPSNDTQSSIIKCRHCALPINSNAKFCMSCGKSQFDTPATSESTGTTNNVETSPAVSDAQEAAAPHESVEQASG